MTQQLTSSSKPKTTNKPPYYSSYATTPGTKGASGRARPSIDLLRPGDYTPSHRDKDFARTFFGWKEEADVWYYTQDVPREIILVKIPRHLREYDTNVYYWFSITYQYCLSDEWEILWYRTTLQEGAKWIPYDKYLQELLDSQTKMESASALTVEGQDTV